MWSSKWNKSPYIVGMLLCKRSAWIGPTLCHVVKEIFACEDEVIKLFVALVRKIWTRRNTEIFEGQFAHPNTLDAYASAQVHLLSNASKVEHTKWKALNLVRLNLIGMWQFANIREKGVRKWWSVIVKWSLLLSNAWLYQGVWTFYRLRHRRQFKRSMK